MTEPNEKLRDKRIETAARPGDPIRYERRARAKSTILIAIVAVVAIVGVAFVVWLLKPSGNGGRPVPAPRSISTDEANQSNAGTPSGEQTLTISPEEAQRAG